MKEMRSFDNREELTSAQRCGCYYCLQTFKASVIREWVDNGQTAICPKCGIDSVAPTAKRTTLRELYRSAFTRYSSFYVGQKGMFRGWKRWPNLTRRSLAAYNAQ